jgi:hypothetical protein
LATKLGIRNYTRNGNTVTFDVVALNADGTIDTSYTGTVTFSSSNITNPSNTTFTAANQGRRTFTVTVNPGSSFQVVQDASNSNLRAAHGFSEGGNLGLGHPGDNVLTGSAINESLSGGAGDDLFFLQGGGNDGASGQGGNDGFYFGGAYTSADSVNGGAGDLDQIGLQGNYSAGVALGTMNQVELVVLLPGNDTRFGDTAGNFYDYNITSPDAAVAAGQLLTVQANTLRAGEDFTFNGSAETNGTFLIYGGLGADNLTGGSGDDGFFFGQGRLGASDVVNGGAGTLDQVGLQGNFTGANRVVFGATQLSGVEFVVLLSASDNRFGAGGGTASYDLQLNNGNVAAGQRLIISANTLKSNETLVVRGAAETDGSLQIFSGAGNDVLDGSLGADDIWAAAGDDRVFGNAGGDTLRGGSGFDIFQYVAVADSTPAAPDRIADFQDGDRIDLDVLAAAFGGNFSFIGDSPQSGPLQVQVIGTGISATVNIFTNGDAVADLVINLNVVDGHTLTRNDFSLGNVDETANASVVSQRIMAAGLRSKVWDSDDLGVGGPPAFDQWFDPSNLQPQPTHDFL